MTEPKRALRAEYRIIKNVLAKEMESEMGAQFKNYQTSEYL